jgi:ectoine hydroxylase-related dioxygenase (phytanoyl-CoA dioxygenase family)
MFEVIELFEEVGLGTLIADHLGEWPALSAAKCNLRRTPIDVPGGWHQDGSFMGRDIATIDVWIALSDCGRDAPGLDVVPHRFDYLLETGFDAVVVPHEKVLDAVEPLGVEIVSREFRAGDVMLFDHMFLHRTAVAPAMVAERHALETWFFAPSSYPERQIPILY